MVAALTALLLVTLVVSSAHAQSLAWRYDGARDNSLTAVASTDDGGVVAVEGGWYNAGPIVVTRFDRDGALVWRRAFGGHVVDTGASSIGTEIEPFEGGFLVGGTRWGRPYLLAISPYGDSLWDRTLGTAAWGRVEGIAHGRGAQYVRWLEIPDSGLLVYTVARVDPRGGILWRHDDTVGGGRTTLAHSDIDVLADAGAIVAGYTDDDGVVLPFSLRFDIDGALLRRRVFDDPGTTGFLPSALVVRDDGTVVLAGARRIAAGGDARFVMMIDAEEHAVWTRELDSAHQAMVVDIVETAGGALAIGGFVQERQILNHFRPQFSLGLLSPTGVPLWDSLAPDEGMYAAVTTTSDSAIVLVGFTAFIDGFGGITPYSHAAELRINAAPTTGVPIARTATLNATVFPVPTTSHATIAIMSEQRIRARIGIYDARGVLRRTLLETEPTAGRRDVVWDGLDADGAEVPAGRYFVEVLAGEERASGTVVIAR